MGYELVAGDTASKLIATCKDNDTKAAIDLLNKTVKLKYKIGGSVLQTKTMTVQTPTTNGKAEYIFGANELTEGDLKGEVEIIDASSKVITSLDPMILSVRAKL